MSIAWMQSSKRCTQQTTSPYFPWLASTWPITKTLKPSLQNCMKRKWFHLHGTNFKEWMLNHHASSLQKNMFPMRWRSQVTNILHPNITLFDDLFASGSLSVDGQPSLYIFRFCGAGGIKRIISLTGFFLLATLLRWQQKSTNIILAATLDWVSCSCCLLFLQLVAINVFTIFLLTCRREWWNWTKPIKPDL